MYQQFPFEVCAQFLLFVTKKCPALPSSLIGFEECVKAGGPFYTLLFFLITPFIWSWQESQIVAELSVAFPNASGSVMWCEAAFGPYAGWLNGLLSWMSGATGTGIVLLACISFLDTRRSELTYPSVRTTTRQCNLPCSLLRCESSQV